MATRKKRTAVNPQEILRQVSPQDVPAAAPPGIANYRAADMQGIACAFCAKFAFTGMDGDVPTGVCEQWEANVNGAYVCDRFASGLPEFDHLGNEVWDVVMSASLTEPVEYHEIHMTGGALEERDGKWVKGILRTGNWDVTPTPMGKIRKPLSIIRDGKSDPANGIIALSEIVQNFKSRSPIKRVQMPFADKKNDDHVKDGNLARVNTGFVDDIWIEDKDGVAELMAACDVRDPEVLEGIQKRTLEDVSSGVPFHPEHGAFLEHVCITNTPFIDGLTPWLTASDDAPEGIKEAEVVHHVLPADEEEQEGEEEPEAEGEPEGEPETPPEVPELSLMQIVGSARTALTEAYGATGDYEVIDATPTRITIANRLANMTWTVPFTMEGETMSLPAYEEWTVEDEGEAPPPSSQTAPRSESLPETEEDKLEAARRLRTMRLAASAQGPINHNGGGNMTVISREELDRLELSDEQRRAFENLLDENATLTVSTREKDADARVDELKGWGFSGQPGALKLYRRVFLADDGGPAIVTFADDGKTKEPLTALQILDQFIDAMRTEDGKVEFSDMHTQSGNDDPPPANGEKPNVEQRVQDARDFLYPNGRPGASKN